MISMFSIERITPLFSVAGTILNTKSLIDGGIEPAFLELLLPSLITTYGPAFFANSLYSRYEMTSESVGLYAVGFILSMFIYSNSFLMFFIGEIPYISKFFSLVKLKNSTENTFSMMSWIVSRDIAGICIKNLVLKKRLKMKATDLFNMAVMYGGVLFLRKYRLQDYYIIIVAGIVPLTAKAVECIKKGKKEQKSVPEPAKDKVSQSPTPAKKTPRRKASISVKLNKNE